MKWELFWIAFMIACLVLQQVRINLRDDKIKALAENRVGIAAKLQKDLWNASKEAMGYRVTAGHLRSILVDVASLADPVRRIDGEPPYSVHERMNRIRDLVKEFAPNYLGGK